MADPIGLYQDVNEIKTDVANLFMNKFSPIPDIDPSLAAAWTFALVIFFTFLVYMYKFGAQKGIWGGLWIIMMGAMWEWFWWGKLASGPIGALLLGWVALAVTHARLIQRLS